MSGALPCRVTGSVPRAAGLPSPMTMWPEETIKPFVFDRPADWLVFYQVLWEKTQTWKENKPPIIKPLFIALLQSMKY